MIKPTVGRSLLYNPKPQDNLEQIDDQPLLAFLIAVLKEKEGDKEAGNSRVNLFVISASGQTRYLPRVLLWQGEGDRPKGGYAEWMPYQKAVAEGKTPPVLHKEDSV
jgi:hypothetical protein